MVHQTKVIARKAPAKKLGEVVREFVIFLVLRNRYIACHQTCAIKEVLLLTNEVAVFGRFHVESRSTRPVEASVTMREAAKTGLCDWSQLNYSENEGCEGKDKV